MLNKWLFKHQIRLKHLKLFMNFHLAVKEKEWELLFNQIPLMDISFILKELIKLLKIKYLKFKEDF